MDKAFVCQTCDEHGNPNWTSTVPNERIIISREELEALRDLAVKLEPRVSSPKRETWRLLWKLTSGWRWGKEWKA